MGLLITFHGTTEEVTLLTRLLIIKLYYSVNSCTNTKEKYDWYTLSNKTNTSSLFLLGLLFTSAEHSNSETCLSFFADDDGGIIDSKDNKQPYKSKLKGANE